MAKGGSSTTQEQNVSHSTTVSVTNVIEDKGLEPLERLKLLADVFTGLDQAQAAQRNAGTPQTVLGITQVPGTAFLAQPQVIIMLTAAAAALILITKRVK